ncbi:MAG: hypothetical protein JOZ57_06345, partial [Abitibacteriaceae bacterium]|nr:hypothetical protein [Abditibacteriaceae bacterium]
MSRLSTRLKGRQLIWSLVPVALGLVIVQLQTAHRRAYVPLQNVRLPRLYLFPQRVAALAFSPDSHRLAIADAQQQLWFYNLATRQFESHFDHQCQDDAQSLAWHQPDCLVVGDLERTRVFVLPRGTLQRTTPPLQQKRARRYEPDHYYQTVLSPTGNVAARGDVLGLIEV